MSVNGVSVGRSRAAVLEELVGREKVRVLERHSGEQNQWMRFEQINDDGLVVLAEVIHAQDRLRVFCAEAIEFGFIANEGVDSRQLR